MRQRKRTTPWKSVFISATAVVTAFAAGVCLPPPAQADIYRWEDQGGVIHFTDDPATIPEAFRHGLKPILKEPPPSGRPSLSNTGAPAAASPNPVGESSPPSNGAASEIAPPAMELQPRKAEQLRAKIDAKERFLEKIDNKRSNILNPLGNRFVSPEDLELYNKYKEELPRDRERLREIESGSPGAR